MRYFTHLSITLPWNCKNWNDTTSHFLRFWSDSLLLPRPVLSDITRKYKISYLAYKEYEVPLLKSPRETDEKVSEQSWTTIKIASSSSSCSIRELGNKNRKLTTGKSKTAFLRLGKIKTITSSSKMTRYSVGSNRGVPHPSRAVRR